MSSQQPEPSSERRRAPRLRTASWLGAQVAILLDSQIIDLSAAGLQAELDFAAEIGTAYEFLLPFEDRALKVKGVVRNVRPLMDSLNAVGVEFIGLSEEDAAFLASVAKSGDPEAS